MRGHTQLIAMRKRRHRPTFVSIDVAADRNPWLYDHWHEQGLQAYLLVEHTDPVERLDLRCVVGLLVFVDGSIDDRQRVVAVYEAAVAAGASRVLGALHRRHGEELAPVEYMDTAGVLTWLE